jgi:HEAT repeat protein
MKKLIALAACGLLLTAPAARAESRADEAARYTEQLKKAKDAKSKITAIEEIGKLGLVNKKYAKDAVPYIMEACKDRDTKVRATAAQALGEAYSGDEDEKVVTLLTDMLKKEKEEDTVKMAAARGLAAMGPRAAAALPTLREIMQKEPQQSRLRNALRQSIQSIQPRKQ